MHTHKLAQIRSLPKTCLGLASMLAYAKKRGKD